ncbi:hypothetical protein GCM10027035_10800 [Emticicia sediminis]
MTLKQINIIVIPIMFFFNNAIGQTTQRKGEIQKDTIVSLLQKEKYGKTVILFQSDKYSIKTSLDTFKENIENWVAKYPHLKEDLNLLRLIIEEANSKNEIDAPSIAKNNNLLHRLEYRLSDIIQSGKCIILNKENNKVLNSIKVQTYSYHCGRFCGGGGRRFFVDDFILLQVVDWIS